MKISKYTKAIVSILSAVLVAISTAMSDGMMTGLEFTTIAIALVTAISVYLVPNLDGAVSQYSKGIVAFAGAGLAALSTILVDVGTVSTGDILTIVIAGLGAIGVLFLPNDTSQEVPEIDDSEEPRETEFVL